MTDKDIRRSGAATRKNAGKTGNGEASGRPFLLRLAPKIPASLRLRRQVSFLRRRAILPLLAATLLAACAGGPPAPDWQATAHDALTAYRSAYLKGETRVAEAEFARARQALARTGRADLVARAELTRCAVRMASLEAGTESRNAGDERGESCPGFAALAIDADEAAHAYADFLAGRATDPARLPAQYRDLAAGEAALAGIADPLPRLVAAGVLLRCGRLSPTGIDLAVDTAAGEGWRRPLLAWLGVQAELATARGDDEGAARARRRAALVTGER